MYRRVSEVNRIFENHTSTESEPSHDEDQSDLLASSWHGSGLLYSHVETCCQGGQPEQVVDH